MKITKQYLKQVIKEELQKVTENINLGGSTYLGIFTASDAFKVTTQSGGIRELPGHTVYAYAKSWDDPEQSVGIYNYQLAAKGAKQHLGDIKLQDFEKVNPY